LEKINQNSTCAIIPCAGKGSRSGLDYPKSLFIIKQKPIIIRILEKVSLITKNIFIVINNKDEIKFNKILNNYKFEINYVYQNKAKGMGDALLKSEKQIIKFKNILLIWGDIPFIQNKTIKILANDYFSYNYDFLFISRIANNPYTLVKRDKKNNVISVIESRQSNDNFKRGEREIGLFMFKKSIVFNTLKINLSSKYGNKNNEHGFLYIIEHLVKKKYKVQALKIAKHIETKSLNYLKDLK
tara:strand:- start:3400 stop:4125 length:726 start_codon:yes stop_codon:yes gene_type:complete